MADSVSSYFAEGPIIYTVIVWSFCDYFLLEQSSFVDATGAKDPVNEFVIHEIPLVFET